MDWKTSFLDGIRLGVWTCLFVEIALVFLFYNNLPALFTRDPPPAIEEDSASSRRRSSSKATTKTTKEDDQPTAENKEPVRLHAKTKLSMRMFPPTMPVETCEWISVILKQLTVQQLTNDINSRLCRALNNEFSAVEFKTKILSYIYASNLDIGKLPPEFKSIRILPSDSQKPFDLEVMAKMVYNGGFTMDLHMHIQLYSVVEVHVKVSVLDCFGNVNIRVAAVPNGPETDFYIYLAMSEDPQFRLDIQSMLGQFSDLAMVDQVITGALKVVLRRLLVEPNGYKFRWSPVTGITQEKLTAEEKKSQMERAAKKKKNLGPITGRLHIFVHEASGLPGKDNLDPYCIVSFNRQVKKTRVIPKSADPRWDEHFSFDVFDQMDDVVLSVYDREKIGTDVFIGHSIVTFGAIPTDIKIKYVLELKKRKTAEDVGLIKFEALFEKFHQQRMVLYNRELDFSQFDNAFIDVMDPSNNLRPSPSFFSHSPSDSKLHALSRSPSSILTREEQTSPSFSSTGVSPAKLSDIMTGSLEETKSSVHAGIFRSGSELLEMFSSASPSVESKVKKSSDVYKLKIKPMFEIRTKIIQGRGLMPCDSSGLSDPYATVYIDRDSLKTEAKKATLSPIWNETLTFQVLTIPKSILVTIYDHNYFGQRVFMGEVSVSLEDVKVENGEIEWQGRGKSIVLPLNNVQSRQKSAKPDPNVTGEIELSIDLKVLTTSIVPLKESQSQSDFNNTMSRQSSVDSLTNLEATDRDKVKDSAPIVPPKLPARTNNVASEVSSSSPTSHNNDELLPRRKNSTSSISSRNSSEGSPLRLSEIASAPPEEATPDNDDDSKSVNPLTPLSPSKDAASSPSKTGSPLKATVTPSTPEQSLKSIGSTASSFPEEDLLALPASDDTQQQDSKLPATINTDQPERIRIPSPPSPSSTQSQTPSPAKSVDYPSSSAKVEEVEPLKRSGSSSSLTFMKRASELKAAMRPQLPPRHENKSNESLTGSIASSSLKQAASEKLRASKEAARGIVKKLLDRQNNNS